MQVRFKRHRDSPRTFARKGIKYLQQQVRAQPCPSQYRRSLVNEEGERARSRTTASPRHHLWQRQHAISRRGKQPSPFIHSCLPHDCTITSPLKVLFGQIEREGARAFEPGSVPLPRNDANASRKRRRARTSDGSYSARRYLTSGRMNIPARNLVQKRMTRTRHSEGVATEERGIDSGESSRLDSIKAESLETGNLNSLAVDDDSGDAGNRRTKPCCAPKSTPADAPGSSSTMQQGDDSHAEVSSSNDLPDPHCEDDRQRMVPNQPPDHIANVDAQRTMPTYRHACSAHDDRQQTPLDIPIRLAEGVVAVGIGSARETPRQGDQVEEGIEEDAEQYSEFESDQEGHPQASQDAHEGSRDFQGDDRSGAGAEAYDDDFEVMMALSAQH